MESKIKNGRTGIHSDSKDIQKQKNFGEKITIYVVFKEDHHTTNLSLLNYDLLIRTIVKRSSIICQLKIVGHDKTRTFLLLRKHFMYMQVHCSTHAVRNCTENTNFCEFRTLTKINIQFYVLSK